MKRAKCKPCELTTILYFLYFSDWCRLFALHVNWLPLNWIEPNQTKTETEGFSRTHLIPLGSRSSMFFFLSSLFVHLNTKFVQVSAVHRLFIALWWSSMQYLCTQSHLSASCKSLNEMQAIEIEEARTEEKIKSKWCDVLHFASMHLKIFDKLKQQSEYDCYMIRETWNLLQDGRTTS